ncbi:hypothetical protein [Flagellimonas sp.]|uniref:hypothetical protein n=1 Tax=Flagellimonas sp. TaxID=2058762 RepID=UPI003B5A6C4C
MKTVRFSFWVIPFIIMFTILSSCSAEDGAVGPAGPQGPQGEQGVPGTDGQDGVDGQDANSSVISSGWFQIDTWTTNLPDFKFVRIPDLILTESQIENNVFLMYRRHQPFPTSTIIELLPLVQHDGSGAIELLYKSPIQGNGLFIQIESFGRNVSDNEYLGPETQFRYMIIEPPSTADKRNIVDFSKMSYQEIVEHLGINP